MLLFSATKIFVCFDIRRLDYKICMCSMAGRQVFEVPPENVGGSPYCLAVGLRGTNLKKVG